MPTPTREQYDAMARKVAASAPEGLSREQFYAQVDAEMDKLGGAPEGAPGSTFSGDSATALRASGRGAWNTLTSPIQAVKGAYDLGEDLLTTGGQRTIKGVQRLLTDGSADELGEAVGSVGAGVVAGRVLPSVPGAVRSFGRSTPASVASGVVRGAAENIPGVSPLVRGAYRGGREALGRRQSISGGRLVEQNPQRLAEFAYAVEGELSKALEFPVESMRSGGSVKPIRGVKNQPVLNPEVQDGMVSTQPDKWGATSTFPKSEIDTALRGVQTRGPMRSATESFSVSPRSRRPINLDILTPEERAFLVELRSGGR